VPESVLPMDGLLLLEQAPFQLALEIVFGSRRPTKNLMGFMEFEQTNIGGSRMLMNDSKGKGFGLDFSLRHSPSSLT